MSPSWVTFAFEAANFLLLAALLGWLFFRPVRAAVEERRRRIEGEQRAAAAAREQAERERDQARAQRAEQDGRLDLLREQLRREAEKQKETLLVEARAQMQREKEKLEQELRGLRRAQVHASARDAAHAAHEIVRQLLAELKGPELEELLVGAACRELEVLRSGGALAPIVIESAGPLAAAAKARLLTAAGAESATCRSDAELIAGMRVFTARGLVDATVQGASDQAERLLAGQLDRESGQHE